MKSIKAKKFLDGKSPLKVHPVSKTTIYGLISRYDAERAIDIAEAEMAERFKKEGSKVINEVMSKIFHANMADNIVTELMDKIIENVNK